MLGGSDTAAVMTFVGSKPRSSAITALKLASNNPAPTSRPSASATCAVASTLRTRLARRLAVPPRLSSRSSTLRFIRRSFQTGAMPSAAPTAIVNPAMALTPDPVETDLVAARELREIE